MDSEQDKCEDPIKQEGQLQSQGIFILNELPTLIFWHASEVQITDTDSISREITPPVKQETWRDHPPML